MAKRKRTKGQTMIYKALHRKLTIEHHEPGDEPRCSGRVSSSCSTGGTRRITPVQFGSTFSIPSFGLCLSEFDL